MSDIANAARAKGYDEQYGLLTDGEASKADYEEAVAQAVSCMKEEGLVVKPVEIDKADSLSLMISADPGGLSMDEASELMVTCLDSKVAYVEDAYLSTHQPVMDPALLAESTTCLSAAGVTLTGNEASLTDLRTSAGTELGPQVNQCVAESLQKVSPGSTTNLKG